MKTLDRMAEFSLPGRSSGSSNHLGRNMAKWIAIGAACGAAFGVIVGNIALWLPIGVAVGAALGTTQSRTDR
jgi:uncharacterized membrane protein YoaK (UPF0700 family)